MKNPKQDFDFSVADFKQFDGTYFHQIAKIYKVSLGTL
jgi:hypothetical protein